MRIRTQFLLSACLISLHPFALCAEYPQAPKDLRLTCENPVSRSDTAQSLKQRFGNLAQIEEIDGAEGETQKVLVLFAKQASSAYRVEVFFSDLEMKKVAGLRVNTEKGLWSYNGLKIGDAIQSVEKANGKPIQLFGFGWDYGGHVVSLQGGTLAAAKPGCQLHLRFNINDSKRPSQSIMGDKRIKSNMPELKRVGAYLSEISLDFSTKP
ncbi:MAG: hypothetical protein E6Q34_05885 [Burkholderiaceae bacterium]|nr:MAG: hypothetical protein E6Q34_05885 [Burkholderiaceae bacterium]